jgi:hypothetical protein
MLICSPKTSIGFVWGVFQGLVRLAMQLPALVEARLFFLGDCSFPKLPYSGNELAAMSDSDYWKRHNENKAEKTQILQFLLYPFFPFDEVGMENREGWRYLSMITRSCQQRTSCPTAYNGCRRALHTSS